MLSQKVNPEVSDTLEIIFTIKEKQPKGIKTLAPVSVQFGIYSDTSTRYINMRIKDAYKDLNPSWTIPGTATMQVNGVAVRADHILKSGEQLKFYVAKRKKF